MSDRLNWNILSIPKKERLTLWMLDCNALALLDLDGIGRKVLCFRSSLSREILLILASCCGECELRKLYKKIDATPTAIRLHVQSLMDDGYVDLSQHATNRRCKVLQLTDSGLALLREYEQQVHEALRGWQDAQQS